MQVAYIPQPKAVQPLKPQQAQKPSDKPQSDDNSFLSALNQKLNETPKAPVDAANNAQNVPKEPVSTDDKSDEAITPQIVDIPITATMMPLIEAFTEQAVSAVTEVQTNVTAEIKTNVPVESAQTAPPTSTTLVSPNTTLPVETDVKFTDIIPTDNAALAEDAEKPQTSTENIPKVEQTIPRNETPETPVKSDVKEPVMVERVMTVKAKHEPRPDADFPKSSYGMKLPKTKTEMVPAETGEVIIEAVTAEPELVSPKALTEVTNESKVDSSGDTVEVNIMKVATDTAEDSSQTTSSDSEKSTEQSQGTIKTQSEAEDTLSNLPKEFYAFELQAGRKVVTISDVAAQIDANTKATAPQTQLSDAIKQNLTNGRTEFEMQLTPVNLGKITVKMVAENGVLTVEFVAENPKTQALLQNNVGEIRELIQTANGTQQVITPNHSESMPQNYTGQERNGQQNQQQDQQQQQQNQQSGQAEQESSEQVQTTVDFLAVLQQLKNQQRSL